MKQVAIIGLVASVGCADGAPDAAALAEICGAAEPVRLLALDESSTGKGG
jgi:hypothetical protein